MRFLIAVFVSLFSFAALAQSVPPPALAANAWVLVDHATGQVLAGKDADARIEPASLTKLMTAYVTFSALKAGTLSPDQQVPVSERAWRMEVFQGVGSGWELSASIDHLRFSSDTEFYGVGVGLEYNRWLRFDVTGEYRGNQRFKARDYNHVDGYNNDY